jgi:K+-sensing histidine kinase KdpD/CheY-like chemotaxis protein
MAIVENGRPLSTSVTLIAVLVVLALVALLSLWERRLAAVRRGIRMLTSASEDVVFAASPGEIARKLMGAMSPMPRVTGVGMFLYGRQAQTLESFYGDGSARRYCDMAVDASPVFEAANTALRNRTLLHIPDARRTTLFPKSESVPRSAVFIPMLAQTDAFGILVIECAQESQRFNNEQQTALQHVANQIAAALKVQEQQAIREQLFRTEKLASAAQLMSGIANELRSPIESLLAEIDYLRAKARAEALDLGPIASDARRAHDIVQRLLAFSRNEPVEPEKVELNTLLREIADLHESAPRSKSVTLRRRLADQNLFVMGSREQLAQVLLNLLIYAEQSASAGAADSRTLVEVRMTSSLLAHRAVVEISWPVKTSENEQERCAIDLSEKTGLSLEICQGIIQTHGGELRVSHPGADVRFQLDLPVVDMNHRREPDRKPQRRGAAKQITVLVVEPEAAGQRHIVSVFSALGHRVVPVASAEEGADLAQRMRFDIAACALRLAGLNWADFLGRVRQHVAAVILMTDGYDAELARSVSSNNVFVVSKPADPSEIAGICETVMDGAAASMTA